MFANTARSALRRAAASALSTTTARALSSATTAPFAATATATRQSAVTAVSAALRTATSGFHSTVAASSEEDGTATAVPYEDKNLSQVLNEELEHERDTYAANEAIESGPPTPWIAADEEGDCEITLTRTYGENEEISVVFNVSEDPYDDEDDTPQMPGEEEEEEEDDLTIQFSVSVTRADGQESLEFACATDGVTVEVRNVRYDAVNSSGEEYETLSSYPGPNYDELDESVAEQFHMYLEARGIDETLANYIMESYEDKEQKEYMGWLHNVSNFVSAKKP